MIRVVKRNGRVETLDISKIQKYTSAAVEGLEGVSQSELEVDAKLQFQDMMSSENIQQTLILHKPTLDYSLCNQIENYLLNSKF
ncbi:MAG: hypothetical protein KU29_10455 [Sulfurovum sp. FS06-10]|nr:MAG: hypothetical protein KU29_10455 [Sulfurovum sp. FS06-10]